MSRPTPHPFPSLPPSKKLLLEELTEAAANLWGEERADALSAILDEHAQHLLDLSEVTPPSVEAPTMGWQNHP